MVNSRDKGRRGERYIANILREKFPEFAANIRRGWQSRMGDDDPDILGIPGFWIENKCGKQPNIRAALIQAIRDAKARATPIAVVKDDRGAPFVALRLSDFIPILRNAFGLDKEMHRGTDREKAGSGSRWEDVSRDEKGRRIVRIRVSRKRTRASKAS